jgi:uncharacterized protein YjeT (DUF2065 family)
MLNSLDFALLILVSLYFVLLGFACLLTPTLAKRFLLSHASSPAAHYAELLVRLMVGAAFLVQSSEQAFATAFRAFGWILIVSSIILLLMPWRWHQRFAARMVPHAIRYIGLIGCCSIALGSLLLIAVIKG